MLGGVIVLFLYSLANRCEPRLQRGWVKVSRGGGEKCHFRDRKISAGFQADTWEIITCIQLSWALQFNVLVKCI